MLYPRERARKREIAQLNWLHSHIHRSGVCVRMRACVCACVRVWLTFVTKLCAHTVFLLAGGGGGGCHVRKVALAVIRSSAQPRDQGKFHATCATKTPIVNRAAPTVYEISQAQLRILSIRPMYAGAQSFEWERGGERRRFAR